MYTVHPIESVRTRDVTIGATELRFLALWARVLVLLRRRLRPAQLDESCEGTEHPERVGVVLKNIAIGSALIHERSVVNDYDLAQIGHIALSSGAPGCGKVLRVVLDNGGTATTPDVERLTGMSPPTAHTYMEQLHALGLAGFRKGAPATVRLSKDFKALLGAPNLKPKGVGEREAA